MTDINGKLVYQRIREASNLRKISLKKLAEKAGFRSPSTIYNYQYGKTTPSETSLRAIAAILNVDINYLKGFTDEFKNASYHINGNDAYYIRESGVPYSVDKVNDKAEQNVLNMFRKSTEGMNEDEKLRFQQSLSKLMDVAKDFNQGK